MDIVEALEEEFAAEPEGRQRIRRSYTSDYKKYLGEVKAAPPKSFKLADLDRFSRSHDKVIMKSWSALSILFASLSPERLMSRFGEDPYLWTMVNYGVLDDRLRGMREYWDGLDNDFLSFERARLYHWQRFHTSNTVQIKDLYELTQMLPEAVERIPLADIIRERSTIDPSEKRVGDYSLTVASMPDKYGMGWEKKWASSDGKGSQFYHCYLDAPAALLLMYKNRPNAMIAFDRPKRGTLRMVQIQGVKRYISQGAGNDPLVRGSRGLMTLDWWNTLVDIGDHVRRLSGTRQLSIQGGHNNYWIKPNMHSRGRILLPLDNALHFYDDKAESRGFVKKRNRDWYQSKDI